MNAAPPAHDEVAGGVSLDALFRANAVGRPEWPALVDPPNKSSFTDLPPRRLSYDETDLAVEHLSRRLRSIGLAPGSIVAIQLPNIVEAVISLLAVARAGLVPAPVPMAWRRAELVAALRRVEPKAMITLAGLDGERPAETACEAAAELFSLSFPCAFGSDLPDGVMGLALEFDVPPASEQSRAGVPHGATVVTFDAAAGGFFPVARRDPQWLAAGLAVLLEARIDSGDAIVSTIPICSLAGIGGALLPWLLSGGALELIHGGVLTPPTTGEKARRTHLLAPASVLAELAANSQRLFASCTAVHRGTRSVGRDFSSLRSERVVDLYCFGEVGTVTLRRTDAAKSSPIPLGPITAPSTTRGGPTVIETKLAGDELRLRGPQVPRVPFSPGNAAAGLEFDEEGFVRTAFRCRRDRDSGLVIVGGPEKVVTIGGLRFGLDDLRSRFAEAVSGVKVVPVEDPLLGERLRIEAENPSATAAALKAAGHSPVVVHAAAYGPLQGRAAS
jgi:hypothetical protein